MPKTQKDLYLAMCDKLGGETGQTLRVHIERISAKKNTDGVTGNFVAKLNEELSDEEFNTKLQKWGGTLRHLQEWAKMPPVETWDRRN